jgi:uncharacterized membrane protein
MRSSLAFFLVILIILSSFAPFTTAIQSRHLGIVSSRNSSTSDGLNWSAPLKVTSNNLTEAYPSIGVDDNANTYIVYYQNGQDFMLQKYQRNGNISVKETRLKTGSMFFQKPSIGTSDAQPTNYFDIGSNGYSHLIWSSGQWDSPNYQRFSDIGKPQSGELDPAISLSYPEMGYLGVSKNNLAFNGLITSYSKDNSYLSRIDSNFNSQMVSVHTNARSISLSVDKWDYSVNVFTRSSTSTGIFHVKFTTDLQTVVSPHEIFTGIINGTGLDSPMPSTTTSPNGHLHFLIYSQSSSPRTIFYAETDKNGTPLLGGQAITVTNTAGDYGDIASDKRGNIYIIWGNANDGQIYYTKVEDGKENASLAKPPVLLSKGLSGKSSWPKLAIDHNNGFHVVFLNDAGGDSEVIYKYAYPVVFELYMDPTEQSKMMFIHDGEIKSGNISIKNLGGQKDIIHINTTYKINADRTEDWNAWIENDTVELDTDTFVRLKVFVQAPEIANFNDNIKVCIRAWSQLDPDTNDTICLSTFFMQTWLLSVTCDNGTHMITASGSTEYACQIWNKGDITEDIIVKNIDSPEDWPVIISQDTFPAVHKWAKVDFNVSLTAPSWVMANEAATVTLKVFFASLPSVRDITVLRAMVAPSLSLHLMIDEPIRYVDPGERTVFNFNVYNNGNIKSEAVLSLDFPYGNEMWNAVLDTNSVTVPSGAYRQFNLIVMTPWNSPSGTTLQIKVQALINGTDVLAYQTCIVTVRTVQKIWANIYQEMVAVEPGGTAKFELDLINTGNIHETLTYDRKQIEPDWLLGIYHDGRSLDNISIDMDESQRFCVTLSVPSNALSGLYHIAVNLKDSSEYNVTFHLSVKVLQIYPIEIISSVGRKNGTPNGFVAFDLIIANLGNGQDLIKLTLDNPPSYWNYHFAQYGSTVVNVGLRSKEKATVQLILEIPGSNHLRAYSYRFHVRAISIGGYQTSTDVAVDLLLANLRVEKLTYSPLRLVEKQNVIIQVQISNYGHTPSENVTVQFFDGYTLAGETVVESLQIGSRKLVNFNWITTAGSHKFKFVVDPKNTTFEFNEDDNVRIEKVNVRGSEKPVSNDKYLPILALLLPIITLIIVLELRRNVRKF